jgi:hypothetical protein
MLTPTCPSCARSEGESGWSAVTNGQAGTRVTCGAYEEDGEEQDTVHDGPKDPPQAPTGLVWLRGPERVPRST